MMATGLAFQHTAARRRLVADNYDVLRLVIVSTHSRPKAAGSDNAGGVYEFEVSTHSRPKAAGKTLLTGFKTRWFQHTAARRRLGQYGADERDRILRFNTQPPEGGWHQDQNHNITILRFNTQPPEGGWFTAVNTGASFEVSTHSRPKAAGCCVLSCQ